MEAACRPSWRSDSLKQATSEEIMAEIIPFNQSQFNSNVILPIDLPFYDKVLDWVTSLLGPAGFPKPLCKRLAVIICGLVASDKATIGEVTTAVESLVISMAKGESIARRLQRTLQDARLDPSILPAIFRPLLPEILRNHLLSHSANKGTPAWEHANFVGVVIAVDESSQEDHVHLLVGGIPVGGTVLPLAVRTWTQNVPLPEGEYWMQVTGLLHDIQDMLPPELRDHVMLTADRAYGVPRMLDILIALDWHWLLRVKGQIHVRLRDGSCCPVSMLAPKPGTSWSGGFSTAEATEESKSEPIGVFKTAGWRRSQVVAMWAEGKDEPWLLVTSLPAKLERVAEYAQRWSIERLFLSWKSHGWAIEASSIHDPQHLGRLMTGIALATLWRLAMALPSAFKHLADLASRISRTPRQLPLPGFAQLPRPWVTKYSLLSWGAKVATTTILRMRTPALCWHLPFWQGRTWKDVCCHTYLKTHGQFSAYP
jgi:hypothetical protein